MKKITSFLLVLLLLPMLCQAYNLTISWDANKESDLAGYKLFIGNSSGSYTSTINVGTTNAYTVNNVTPGLTYYAVIRAFDLSGNESSNSKEVSALIPIDQILLTQPLDGQIISSRPTLKWTASGFTKYALYASINEKSFQKAYSGTKNYYTVPLATWIFYIKKGSIVKWYVIGTTSSGTNIQSATYSFTKK